METSFGSRRCKATCDCGPADGQGASRRSADSLGFVTIVESHRNCWRRTLQGDQCGRVENLELDLVRVFGVPSFDVLRDPGDVDISPAGICDQVEAI